MSNPEPVEIASLAVALLCSQSFETLLHFCSPLLKDRVSMLNLPLIQRYQWTPDSSIDIWLQNVNLQQSKCYYKVLDPETLHCIVAFEMYQFHGQIGVVLLYMNEQKWTFHDIKKIEMSDQFEEWSCSHQLAKQHYSLQPEEMLVDDDYWNLYNTEGGESPKRPIEEVDDAVDYWDRY
jgi:hypothetical protein